MMICVSRLVCETGFNAASGGSLALVFFSCTYSIYTVYFDRISTLVIPRRRWRSIVIPLAQSWQVILTSVLPARRDDVMDKQENESQWKSMKINENQRKSMRINENQWESMKANQSLDQWCDTYGADWRIGRRRMETDIFPVEWTGSNMTGIPWWGISRRNQVLRLGRCWRKRRRSTWRWRFLYRTGRTTPTRCSPPERNAKWLLLQWLFKFARSCSSGSRTIACRDLFNSPLNMAIFNTFFLSSSGMLISAPSSVFWSTSSLYV